MTRLFTQKHYCFKSLLAFLLAFVHIQVIAQAPVISSFSPSTGIVGSTVVINGRNFSPTAQNNTVYFGAVRANVLTAGTTTLTVAVPNVATYAPLTVTTNGLTGYAAKPFVVTFSAPTYSAASFLPKKDVSSSFVSGVAHKDLDGDGKIDVVAVNSSSISIYKNNSTPGDLSFGQVLIKNLNNYSVGVAIDDLDGDGKPDIVVTNFNASTISIFKNTTAGGVISFDDPIILATGTHPYNVAIADFNLDGKPDIAVTDQDSSPATVTVFTNTTTGGAISFGNVLKLPSEGSARGISVGDIDMDGKPDIVIASQSSTIAIFRNTSVGNTVNFAPKTVFNMPSAGGTESVCIADLDGDLIPDLSAANNNSPGSISVLRNLSTPGNIQFASRVDIPVELNPYSIAAGDINGDGKPDIAVTNQVSGNVTVLINTSTAGNITFASKITLPVGLYPRSVNIADIDGSGKPDIIVGNNDSSSMSFILTNTSKLASVITFPSDNTAVVNSNNFLLPGAVSTNNEVPIIYSSNNNNVAVIDPDGNIKIIGPGTVIITADQAANSNYNAALPVSRTYNIKKSQTIQFPAIGTKTSCTANFSTNATSDNNSIPLNYSSSNNNVANIDAQGIIQIVGAGTTTITVSQPGNSLFNQAIPQSRQLIVETPPLPIVSISAQTEDLCENSPVQFKAEVSGVNVPDLLHYQWTVNGTTVGTDQNTLIVSKLLATDAVKCVVTNNSACAVKGTSNILSGFNIQPIRTPTITISSSAAGTVCPGTAVTFTASTTNRSPSPAYRWKLNGIDVGENKNTFEISTLKDKDEVSCILITSDQACTTPVNTTSNLLKISISGLPQLLPSVTIKASSNNVVQGTSINLTALTQNAGTVLSYQWLINGKVTETNGTAVYRSSGFKNNDEIRCIITTDVPCVPPAQSEILKLTILPPPTIDIPNGFTPNNDGINDTWNIPALLNFPTCTVNIYDRTGRAVYNSLGYSAPWDGEFKGTRLPAATYYYVIALGPQKILSGSVVLIR